MQRPPGAGIPAPHPAGTYLVEQHREDGERQQEPTSHFGGAALVPSLSSPLSSRQREKGKVSLGVKGKNTVAKAARPSRAGRVNVTVSFFQECL